MADDDQPFSRPRLPRGCLIAVLLTLVLLLGVALIVISLCTQQPSFRA
jgi:hypothetical protein